MNGIINNPSMPEIALFRFNVASTANVLYTGGATIPFIEVWKNTSIPYAENGAIKFTKTAKILFEFSGTFYNDNNNGRNWVGLCKNGIRIATSIQYGPWNTHHMLLPINVDNTTSITFSVIERTNVHNTGVGLQGAPNDSFINLTKITILQ